MFWYVQYFIMLLFFRSLELCVPLLEPVDLRAAPVRLFVHRIGRILRTPQRTDGQAVRNVHRFLSPRPGSFGHDLCDFRTD